MVAKLVVSYKMAKAMNAAESARFIVRDRLEYLALVTIAKWKRQKGVTPYFDANAPNASPTAFSFFSKNDDFANFKIC